MARYLITSALPYINGIKHLGNLVGSMLPGDVYARFLRQMGHEVLYICGTDEHGTPAEIAAQEAGKPVASYCQDMYTVQKDIYDRFHLSFDYFGRSSGVTNHQLTQEIFKALDANGLIEERSTQQYYSPQDQRFLPDRYVMGICPHCDYDKARGDQCDGCGRLLDPLELKKPYSALSGSYDLQLRESKHLFLLLNRMETQLQEWIDTKADWPAMTKGIAYKWLKEGLQPRCITRDLNWGVPVPKPGYEGKVFYVWFDAPIAYISMTKDAIANAWKEWWQPERLDDVRYAQFMAKDNVAFHSIFFPAMIMACGMNLKLVDDLKSMSWLNYEGGKFSTSQGRGIFLDKALDLFPADYWRYYLMAHIPETDDTNFTMTHFAEVINKDLVGSLGNFINRVLNLVVKYAPQGLVARDLPQTLHEHLQQLIEQYHQALYDLKFRQAMETLRAMWRLGNSYITEKEPWKLVKDNEKEALDVLAHCLALIRIFAEELQPIMPERSHCIHDLMQQFYAPETKTWHVTTTPLIFTKIVLEDVA